MTNYKRTDKEMYCVDYCMNEHEADQGYAYCPYCGLEATEVIE